MRDKIEKVLEAMKADYKDWSDRCAKGEKERAINTTMYEEYCEGLEISEGPRYWKITGKSGSSRSVKGFIVKAGDKKFREGDMLKPAGWNAPARNFARGNVFEERGNVRWTGIG
tara:strand:- start:337 stop:678 length:342 start_codon:yes stop_codon:yes gene_type:complete